MAQVIGERAKVFTVLPIEIVAHVATIFDDQLGLNEKIKIFLIRP